MGFAKWAVDKAYQNHAIKYIKREHQAFVDSAEVGRTYWSAGPYISAKWSVDPLTEDVHMKFVFVKKDVGRLLASNGLTSWQIWWEFGPLTSIPQQTQADINTRNARLYGGESARIEAEIQKLFPASYEAFVNA
jgi:hypothetical protein